LLPLFYLIIIPNGVKEILSIIDREGQKDRCTVVNNIDHKWQIPNLYEPVHKYCKDDEIIVNVDGDDWLTHPEVFSQINAAYSSADVWITYGSFIEYPSYKLGFCRPYTKHVLDRKGFRKHPFVSSHTRTYYAGLFKKIRLEDFMYHGEFFISSGDLAMMWPMLEMAHDRFAYIPYANYHYNRANLSNDAHAMYLNTAVALRYAEIIYNMKPYEPLTSLNVIKEKEIDILLISQDNHVALEASLQALLTNVSDFRSIYILIPSSNNNYLPVKEKYPDCKWIEEKDMKKAISKYQDRFSENMLILSDHILFKEKVSLENCLEKLDQTHAKAFYFLFGNNIIYSAKKEFEQKEFPRINLENDIFAWDFRYAIGEWTLPYSLEGALMKKQELKKMLSQMDNFKMNEYYPTDNHIGLYCKKSKAIYLDFSNEDDLTSLLDETNNPQRNAEIKNNVSYYYELNDKGASL